MKKLICFTLSLLLLCSLAGCGRPAGYEEFSAQPIALSDEVLSQQEDKLPAIYEALSQFGLTLLRGTREQTETPTLVSPPIHGTGVVYGGQWGRGRYAGPV